MRQKKIQTILFLLFLPFFIYSQDNKKPGWIINRPIDNEYFIGIGQSNTYEDNFRKKALDQAIEEISAQINVKIESETYSKNIERDSEVDNYFENIIHSRTKNQLKNIEIYANWSDKDFYWVYCRLSKKQYYENIRLERKKKAEMSLQYFKTAKQNNLDNNIADEILNYFKAFKTIEEYIDEPVLIEYEGENINLVNKIKTSLDNTMNNIIISTDNDEYIINPGKIKTITIKVYNKFNNKPIRNLPVIIKNVYGKAEFKENYISGEGGKINLIIKPGNYLSKKNVIQISIDIQSIYENTKSPLLKAFIKNIYSPKKNISLNIKTPKIFIKSSEYNFNNKITPSIVEKEIKRSFIKKGYTFVDEPEEADYSINISAETRRGSYMNGMYSSFASFSISILNNKNYNEIYSNNLGRVTGIGSSYKDAGIKALKNINKKFNKKMLEEILTALN